MITHIDQFLFVFCLLYAKLGTEKASNLEIPVSTHTKKPTKMYLIGDLKFKPLSHELDVNLVMHLYALFMLCFG